MLDIFASFTVGLIIGALVLYLRTRAREVEHRERAVRLETELAHLKQTGEEQRETFKALAGDVLKDTVEQLSSINRTVLDKQQQVASGELDRRREAVESLIKPIGESLEKVNREITELEKERTRTHADLIRLMGSLDASQNALRSETGNLVKALRRPEVKGRWGELQLKKVVEMAGMLDHV
ncbi:DNA recombination protein RmuC, partial [bacterium]|nr:DNA recombination protein RmuC [bacterium]